MSISRAETKQLLESIIFSATAPDAWGSGPLMGESTTAFYNLIDYYPGEQLDNLVKCLYQEWLEF